MGESNTKGKKSVMQETRPWMIPRDPFFSLHPANPCRNMMPLQAAKHTKLLSLKRKGEYQERNAQPVNQSLISYKKPFTATSRSVYTCPHCNKEFSSFRYVEGHNHNFCKDTYTVPVRASTAGFNCKKCKEKFTTQPLLAAHYNLAHWIQRHLCQRCKKGFSTLEDLKKHAQCHWDPLSGHAMPKYKCKVCGESYVSRQALNGHKNKHREKLKGKSAKFTHGSI